MNWFLSQKLATKIAFPLTLVAIIVASVVWQAGYALNRASDLVEEALLYPFERLSYAREAAFRFDSLMIHDRDYLLVPAGAARTKVARDYADDLATVRAALDHLYALQKTAERHAMTEAARAALSRFVETERRAFVLADADRAQEAYALLAGDAATLFKQTAGTLNQIVQVDHDDIGKVRGDVAAGIATVLWRESAIGGIGLVVGFAALGWVMVTQIVTPITAVTGALTELGEGNFAVAVSDIERRDEVGTLARALAGLKQKMIQADLLKCQLIQQTAELTAANRELDSFSYAVSHDLRAPLRALNGFSKALEEDCADQLTGEARDYLDEITIASGKMGDLIEGLLVLSRCTRGELRRDLVDISALARTIAGEFDAEDRERQVTWHIAPDLTVFCDARMIEVVMRNLLGNAWKYTGKTSAAVVTVAARVEAGQDWILVGDNGAGFDPAYAARLFQAFQRLHRQDEFPGLGIGLATVQRIVHRHGGEIRARATPGLGAEFSFYFPGAGTSA